jgi:hypothetical protein
MDTSFARLWLRLEGLAVLAAACAAYALFHLNWVWFAVLFLAPDLSMLGYVLGPKVGAWCYNLAHTYVLALPVLIAGLSIVLSGQHHVVLLGVGLIWCAHIGFDRLLGYGLKSPEGFKVTHLGRIGRDQA